MTRSIEATLDGESGESGGPQRRTLGTLLGLSPAAPDEGAVHAFPLRRVRVRVDIVGDIARSVVEHEYANRCDQPLDVVHIMPLPAGSAVTAFEIRSGPRVVRGVCRDRATAEAAFEDARQRGKTTAMIDEAREDVHRLRLANVPPRSDVRVSVTLVERLRVDAGRFEWRFPTTIAPKFVPGEPIGHEGDGVVPDTNRAPDASALQPPLRLAGGTNLDLEARIAGTVTEMAASVPLVWDEREGEPGGADTAGVVRIAPRAGVTCDRDLVIRFWSRTEHAVARAWRHGDHTLVVVDPPATRRIGVEVPREVVFVLDRSGSMRGPKIEAAKRALIRAMRELTDRDSINVITFHTTPKRFSPTPVEATATQKDRIADWLAEQEAAGGTEALAALRLALTPSVPAGRLRTVVFITDGQVANDVELMRLLAERDPAVRVFAIGIDTAPAAALLARLARLGQGEHLLLGPNDDIENEIARFHAALLGPLACGVTCDGAGRAQTADLFAGRSASFFVIGSDEQVLSIRSGDGRFTAQATVHPAPVPLGPIWAAAHVQRLEDQIVQRPMDRALLEREICQLGLQHQIQTRLTSFVAVDESSQVNGDAVSVNQPAEWPTEWTTELPTGWLQATSVPELLRGVVGHQLISRAPSGLDQIRSWAPSRRTVSRLARFRLGRLDSQGSVRRDPEPPSDQSETDDEHSRLAALRAIERCYQHGMRERRIFSMLMRLLRQAWDLGGPATSQEAMRWLALELGLRQRSFTWWYMNRITENCMALLESQPEHSIERRFLQAYREARDDPSRQPAFDAVASEVVTRRG